MQHCFNLASTLVKATLNPTELMMIVDCEIVEYMLNTLIVFILLNEKTFYYYILTIQLLMKYQKITVVLIVIHNVEAVVQKRSIKKVFLEIS